MADRSLVMTFLNQEGSRASITITLPSVREDLTQAEVSVVMDAIVARDIFTSSGGNLVTKHSAQITERTVTALEVR